MDRDRTAAWTVALAHAERHGHEILGAIAPTLADDRGVVRLSALAIHAGERAAWWQRLWPAGRGGVDGAAGTPSYPDPDPLHGLIARFDTAVADAPADGPGGSPDWEQLAEIVRVAWLVPLKHVYATLDTDGSEVTDEPVRRIASLCVTDCSRDLRHLW